MSILSDYEPGLEPERYELDESPTYRFAVDRRQFLGSLAVGLVVLFLLEDAPAQESGGGRRRGGGGDVPQEIGAWLHVAEDGKVTAFTGKVEVGQNTRSALAQVVAEELRVPVASVHMVMGDTQLTPYDAGTFGSRSIPSMAPILRRAAAATREVLLELAATEWKTDRASLTVADGRVTEKNTGRTIEYGKLTHGQRLPRTVTGEPPVTPPNEWKVAGKPIGKAEGRGFVTGGHEYTPDIQLPGLLYGKILRPPSFGATLATVDTQAAGALPGSVVVRDGEFVGVAAPSLQQAQKALDAVRAEWKAGPAAPSSEELFDDLKRQGRDARGLPADGKLPASSRVGIQLNESYNVAYIAHAPLEPRAAVAQWEGGKLTVWTGTQRPFGVRSELSQAFRIPEESVRVIVPDTGSGYGGKHTGEAALEAARLAKAAGKPVKVVWSREEEFTWAYFRPAGVVEVQATVGPDGLLSAWEFYNYNSGGSGLRSLYEVPNREEKFIPVKAPLRQGSYRGLAATANHFARETAMDELAHALRQDPLAFRLKNLKDERLRAVLEAAAKAFGWGGKATAGHGFGIAGGFEKGSYIATCAEVAADAKTGTVKVLRAVSAFECGAVVSTDHLLNQVEGAVVMGLGGALSEEVQFAEGKITNPRFSKYRVPRFSDMPKMETVILDRKDLPSAGAGETPIVAIAPAIGNAIFAATGVRLRSMPLVLPATAKSK